MSGSPAALAHVVPVVSAAALILAAGWLRPRYGALVGAAVVVVTLVSSGALDGRQAVLARAAPPVVAAALAAAAVLAARNRARREAMLRRLSVTDPLTRLPNRTVAVDTLRRERARRDPHPTTVIFLDLDEFKQVNDRHGHATGDLVLLRTADRLRATVRAEDVVTRYAGDEFVVICSTLGDLAAVDTLCRRLLRGIGQPIAVGHQATLTPSVSIGAVLAGHRDWEPEQLLAAADAAMLGSKGTGRSRCNVTALEAVQFVRG